MKNSKGLRPDYAKIMFRGVFISFIVWIPIFILAAFAGLEAEDASDFSIALTLLLFTVYIVISGRYHERLGATVQNEAYVRARSGGILKCDGCGAQTYLEDHYKVEPRSFGAKPKVYCPECVSKRTASQLKKHLVFYGIFAVGGLVLTGVYPELPFGWILLNIFLAIIFMSISVLPHEIGHALTGTALGMRIHKVIIGYGRLVYSTSILGRPVEFRALPFGGATTLLNKSARFCRLRMFLAVLAGPLANLLIILFMTKLFPERWFYMVDLGAGLQPDAALQLANVLILVIALLPIRSASVAGIIPTDGLYLLILPFMKKPMVVQQIAAAYSYEGMDYRRKKDWGAARKCYEEALSRFPDNPVSLNDKALYFLEKGELENARELLLGMLETPGIDPNIMVVVKNNLAYADAISGRAELLPEADGLSEEAFGNMSWVPAFKGTRGIVLVELGRFEEGRILLNEAVEMQEDPAAKAADYCYLAIAEARSGNADAARMYLEQARSLEPGSHLIAKAESEATGINA